MTTSGLAWRPSPSGRLPAALLIAAVAAAAALAYLPLTWAGALVLASCLILLVTVVPMVGLLLIAWAVPFGSLFNLSLGGVNVGVTEALVWLVLTAWLAMMVARRRVRLVTTGIGIALCMFLAAMVFSLLAARSIDPAAKEVVKWMEVLGLFAFVVHEMEDRWQRPFVATILLAGAMSSLQGIYQFLFRKGPDAFVLFGRFMRAYGTFSQPNPYAGYLGLGVALAFGVVVGCLVPGRTRRRAGWLFLALGTGSLMTAAVVMSWSRGSWLGLTGAIGVMALAAALRYRKSILVSGVLVVVFIIAPLLVALNGAPQALSTRMADLLPVSRVLDVRGIEVTDANFSVVERMAHWQAALEMWRDHPWFGIGIGNYAVAYPQYSLPTWDAALGHAHNYYLNVAAETGLVGLLAYLLVWLLAGVTARRAFRKLSGFNAGLALGILGALTHLCVHNLFDDLFVHGIYLEVGALLGLIAYLARKAN